MPKCSKTIFKLALVLMFVLCNALNAQQRELATIVLITNDYAVADKWRYVGREEMPQLVKARTFVPGQRFSVIPFVGGFAQAENGRVDDQRISSVIPIPPV